jgi:hypothetical protein
MQPRYDHWHKPSNAQEIWDSAKHPRGGFPENPGWFSPSGSGGGSGSAGSGGSFSRSGGHERVKLPSDSYRGERAEAGDHSPSRPPSSEVAGDGENEALLAQRTIRRPALPPGQQLNRPAAQGGRVFPNEFGTFPARPQNPPVAIWTPIGKGSERLKPLSDHLYRHAQDNIPGGIRKELIKGGLQVLVVPKLSDVGRGDEGGRAGGIYSPSEGTILLPQTLNDGTPNPNPERDLRHEFGHAFDHATNGSASHEFLDAYEQDLKDHAPIRDLEMNHYIPGQGKLGRATFDQLQNANAEQKAAGAREAFAEAFAETTQPTKMGSRQKTIIVRSRSGGLFQTRSNTCKKR